MPMASSKSTYAERLCLADSFEEYKEYFSKQHYEFLVHEALEETRRGVGKLKYVLALARRCKGGAVSVETLAEKVDKEYSLLPLPPQEQSGAEGAEGGGQQQIGMEGEGVAEFEDVDTEVDEPGQQDAKEQNNYEQEQAGVDEEEEVPDAKKDKANALIEAFKGGFFQRQRWSHQRKTFVNPGEGYWLDTNNIQHLRNSTHDDFVTATPKPFPVYIERNPYSAANPKTLFSAEAKGYYLCRRVAVSTDGNIYRATNDEIEAALADIADAPSTDAPTYVKAVQELRRRHAIAKALENGVGNAPSEPKRRRVGASP